MKPYRFVKNQRLLDKAAFDAVFSDAQRSFCKLFTVLYQKNTVNHARIGIICGKKVHKHANERNRIKRLIRESFRTYDGFSSSTDDKNICLDLIVLPKPAASHASNTDISSSLQKHWHRTSHNYLKLPR